MVLKRVIAAIAYSNTSDMDKATDQLRRQGRASERVVRIPG